MKFTKNNIIVLAVLLSFVIAGAVTVSIVNKKNVREAVFSSSVGTSLFATQGEGNYTDMSGKEVSFLEDFGKIIIVNSWASWSPYSGKELKKLSEIAASYSGDDIKVVGINRGESASTAEAYLKFLNTIVEVELVLDIEDKYYKSIEGYAMPETVLYNQSGEIVLHIRGEVDETKLRTTIDSLLRDEGG